MSVVTKEPDILTTPIGFCSVVLGMNLYPWQARALTWFEFAIGARLKGSLCTPNGAGKDTIVIAGLALWWVWIHKRGRVVITSKDSRQIDEQTAPALERHRSKFDRWKWIEREIVTPTGGKIILFTTDEPGRAEGFHRETGVDGKPTSDGPLLLIANEAKSIPEEIFTAFDRCTYDGLLYASSPGPMIGRFYESQVRSELGFRRLKVGLTDCPHIPPERIEDIRKTYGDDHPFTRSTLYGEFMEAEGETRFDREGLKHLDSMARLGHDKAALGTLQENRNATVIWIGDKQSAWLWMDEPPRAGGDYLLSCDPNTCEQGAGTTERDNSAACIIRAAHINDDGEEVGDHVVAVLHWPGGVKWDSDVLAERMALLAKFYGECDVVVEANNFGSALIVKLQRLGVHLWQRTKIDDINPNKKTKIAGWLTTERSREHWVQACTTAIREKTLICRYRPATDEFQRFIFLASGRAEAQACAHDDWVSAIGIGLVVRCFTCIPMVRESRSFSASLIEPPGKSVTTAVSKFGACG